MPLKGALEWKRSQRSEQAAPRTQRHVSPEIP
jgi:hypothetical protein